MNKKCKVLKATVIGFLSVILLAFLGCAGMINGIIPCFIDQEAADYAGEKINSILPWSTLRDAERIQLKMEFVHETNQIEFDRGKMDDSRYHLMLQDAQARYMVESKELRDAFTDPSRPAGLMIATLLGGTIGALAIPRPGDEKKKKAA